MPGAAGRPIAGEEVPIPGSDKLRWIKVTVPSTIATTSSSSAAASAILPPHPSEPTVATPPRDASGFHVIPGDPRAYLMWRIHKDIPNVLELIDVSATREFPETGLHLVFQEALCPFAFLCKNEVKTGAANTYLLYVLTTSGVAFVCNLCSPFSYISGSMLPQTDIIKYNVQTHAQSGRITAVTATFGCLVTGRQDGSVGCYHLGKLDPNSPGFFNELCDDVGIGRLWNLMSRAKSMGAVQDVVISELCTRKLLYVLHVNGSLRVWDLSNRTRLLSYNISLSDFQGINPFKLWVGEAINVKQLLSLAILHRGSLMQDCERIAVYNFAFSCKDKSFFSTEPSMYILTLEEGKVIDLKISSDKLWILKEVGPMLYELTQSECDLSNTCKYVLQEELISEQLFQNSECALDDLIWTSNSFSSLKGETYSCISSIFLRRLLEPGVHHGYALRDTLLAHKKYISESDFQSLTKDGLKKEIYAIIEHESAAKNLSATAYYWKNFCARFFHHWCQSNTPHGLLLDPNTDVFGLIRKGSASFFRYSDDIEKLINGCFDKSHNHDDTAMKSLENCNDPVLSEVFKCISHINHQLGGAAAAIYYESLASSFISSDEICCQLLKILETGFSPSATSLVTLMGTDAYLEKRQLAHKSQRKFSVEMLLSLHNLHSRVTNWAKVLDVIEKYLMYLKPRKSSRKLEYKRVCNVNSSVLVQATSQVARAMFDSAFDVLLLLGYLVNISGQMAISQNDIARIKLRLIPMAQDILSQWHILHFVATTPTSTSLIEDFSSQLSSLHLDKSDKLTLHRKLGSSDFTLAYLLEFPCSDEGQDFLCSSFLISPSKLIDFVPKFSSYALLGKSGEEPPILTSPTTYLLASILLRHGQFEAAENLLSIVDICLSNTKIMQSDQNIDDEWCACLHLHGFCLLSLSLIEANGVLKEQKINQAICCFIRAASGQEAPQVLQKFSLETGFCYSGECKSTAVWRLHYYQWAMQLFEQYHISEGACQFALAALEQVDAITSANHSSDNDGLPERATIVQGRLWANVFKCSLDLKRYGDAYCAIISNPDEDSKYICLRRFIIVLCELGATKVLCDGEIPFVGLVEKVEQELFWKAERSDISSRPNLYKILYAFEAHRNNWRKAAGYMYRYSLRLKKEVSQTSSTMQERLYALSASLNAIQLVDRAYAWIDSPYENDEQGSPLKKPRSILLESSASAIDSGLLGLRYCIDVEDLEKDYVLTSAQYLLSLVNDKIKIAGTQSLENLVDFLIHENLYDMAFTVILKFWKGSALKRELEQTFVAMALGCCPNRRTVPFGSHLKTIQLLLPSSKDEPYNVNSMASPVVHQLKGNIQWETLEFYLEKYRKLHPRLVVVVAESILYTDPQIVLPLWLIHTFKGGRMVTSWGMTGQEADPATLFRLYVDYGRHAEATSLLLEYLGSFASLRPADVMNRKKASAIWFPYTAIERLWFQLEEAQNAGHIVDQCDKLKQLLHGALITHLRQVEMDSEDVLSSVP